ncbi:MAG: nickel pincer cofactor biosynthesis protein LarC [Pyrinomonadaceae bacterium]
MRTIYFDCFAGASGDMILGAMVAAGVEPAALIERLRLLPIQGFEVEFQTVTRAGLGATYANVSTTEVKSHRQLSEILDIINRSALSTVVKDRSSKIFRRLAEAEARVHNQTVEQVHFHEVGALDAILDIVGAAICFELLQIERFMCSPLNVGSGTVNMAHGVFPVPPPAVTELLRGVPFYSSDVRGELLTPTGAAIITATCDRYGSLPTFLLEATGYGAGSREYEMFPNVLRVMIGQISEQGAEDARLWMLQTNIDDASPQLIGNVMDRVFELGALDCYVVPVQMKKNRPGFLLSILVSPEQKQLMMELLFTETTTLGVRAHQVERRALERRMITVDTSYGPIDVKVAYLNGRVVNEMPEFEQCRNAARKAGVPLKKVEEAARMAIQEGSRD